MGTQGVIETFLRYIDKNSLKFTTFEGDGYSKCHASVREVLLNAPKETYVGRPEY